jgi:hypothetical protein
MANSDYPRGAHPHGVPLRMTEYDAGGTVYPGDLLKLKDDGTVVVITAADGSIGVAANYAVATGKVMVYDHPDQFFVMQADDGTVDAATDLLLNYTVTVTSGDTLFKISRHELDGNTGDTNSNYPLKLIKIENQTNNALGTHVDCVVKINNHQLAGGTGTLGV